MWQNFCFIVVVDEECLGSEEVEVEEGVDQLEQMEVRQYKEDLYYCVEVWWYVLLVYIERVFKV